MAVVDLFVDAVRQMEELVTELDRWGYRLLGSGEKTVSEEPRVEERAVLAGTKADTPGALDQLGRLEALYGPSLRLRWCWPTRTWG